MKIIVLHNKILATHTDDQEVEHLYPSGSVAYIVPDGNDKFVPMTKLEDCIDLVTAKKIQRQLIDKQTHTLRSQGFVCTVNQVKLQCTDVDLNRWVQAKTLMDLSGADSVDVRDYNNVIVPVPKETFNTMMIELGAYINTLLHTVWAKKDAIDAATTTAEVFAITW